MYKVIIEIQKDKITRKLYDNNRFIIEHTMQQNDHGMQSKEKVSYMEQVMARANVPEDLIEEFIWGRIDDIYDEIRRCDD